jgi:hypothetical protein
MFLVCQAGLLYPLGPWKRDRTYFDRDSEGSEARRRLWSPLRTAVPDNRLSLCVFGRPLSHTLHWYHAVARQSCPREHYLAVLI